MSYEHINSLLKKYEKSYISGECRSICYNRRMKNQEEYAKKLHIADMLFEELPFHLSGDERKRVKYLIRAFRNFRSLHGNASNETVILAMIFYVKLSGQENIKIDRYKISRKYNLTHNTFELILCKMLLRLTEETEILPTPTTEYDHNILVKGSVK